MGQGLSRELGIASLRCNAWLRNCTASNEVVVEDNVRAAFNNFDNDEDGHIDVSELHTALEALGLPCGEAQTAAVLAKFDNDGNLTLEVEEFQKLGASPRARALLSSCNSKCSWNARRLTIAGCRCERITSPFSSVNAFRTFAEMSAAADEVVTKANKRAAAKK